MGGGWSKFSKIAWHHLWTTPKEPKEKSKGILLSSNICVIIIACPLIYKCLPFLEYQKLQIYLCNFWKPFQTPFSLVSTFHWTTFKQLFISQSGPIFQKKFSHKNKRRAESENSQTWVNDHLRIRNTCLQRPPFWGPIFLFWWQSYLWTTRVVVVRRLFDCISKKDHQYFKIT